MQTTPRTSATAVYEQIPDPLLVQRAQQGEAMAMDFLLARHRGRVERLTHSIVKNPMDAEEVAQDVLLSVRSKIDRFRGDSALTTWIHRITVNAALMHKRRDKSSTVVSLDDAPPSLEGRRAADEISTPSRSADETLRDEFWDVIWQAVDELDEKYRTAFILRDVEGLSTEEAARSLGLKIPALKSRLHRARLALRERLLPYLDGAAAAHLAPALAA
jgi:RNA polymerase sigma-70 factor (ECF subfamily)